MKKHMRRMTTAVTAALICLAFFSTGVVFTESHRVMTEGEVTEGESEPPRCTEEEDACVGAIAEDDSALTETVTEETIMKEAVIEETVGRFEVSGSESSDIPQEMEEVVYEDVENQASASFVENVKTLFSAEKRRFDKKELLVHLQQLRKKVRYYDDIPLTREQQELVFRIAEEYGLQPELLYGIMYTESRYTVNIKSANGRNYGIMQINYTNFSMLQKAIGVSDFLDFESNVRSGAYILSLLKQIYSDEAQILMCYNRGEGGAIAQWKKGNTFDQYCASVIGERDRLLAER